MASQSLYLGQGGRVGQMFSTEVGAGCNGHCQFSHAQATCLCFIIRSERKVYFPHPSAPPSPSLLVGGWSFVRPAAELMYGLYTEVSFIICLLLNYFIADFFKLLNYFYLLLSPALSLFAGKGGL